MDDNAANGSTTPRELVAFAFVEEEYARSGDIVTGLMPLFAPLLAKNALRLFDPVSFAQAVEAAYDIPMSPLVAESLVPDLARAGLLVQSKEDPRVYRVAKVETQQEPAEASAIEALLTEFVAFAARSLKQAGLQIDSDQLKDGLLKRLTDLNFMSFIHKPDRNYFKGRKLSLRKEDEIEDSAASPEQALDILCADFAVHISQTAPGKFELLSRLSKGALIADVVLTLQTPSADADLSSVTIVFDGPLILDVLDLSTPELRDYAIALFEIIDRAHLRKAVFLHTLEEMEGTIRAPLDALARGEHPYGPLGSRIRHSATDAAYARAVLGDLQNAISRLGIEVIDAKTYESSAYLAYCPEAIEDSLRNDFGLQQDTFERRQRDAHSIATLVRMRNVVTNPTSLPAAKFVMVTRNTAVADRSRRNLIFRKRIEPTDFPPVLTDRQIAGLLWFAVGGNLGALSRTKLIANCSAALQPRTDIASKLTQMLYESDPERVTQLTALMRDQRARRCLLHETLGSPAAITRDNAEEILEQMRLAAADDIRREAANREEQMRSSFDVRMAALTDAQRAEKLRLEAEILQLSAANRQLQAESEQARQAQQAQLQQLTDSVDRVRIERQSDVDRRMWAAVAFANNARKRLRVLIIFLYVTLIVAAGVTPPSTTLGLVLAVVVGLSGFWFVPNIVFDKALVRVWKRHFSTHASVAHVLSNIDEFDIDPVAGTVSRKKQIIQ
jgi:hypothetical protein